MADNDDFWKGIRIVIESFDRAELRVACEKGGEWHMTQNTASLTHRVAHAMRKMTNIARELASEMREDCET